MDGFVRRNLEDADVSEKMPVDVLPASNGEFVPPPPTEQQKLVMRLQDEKGEELRRRLNMSRREFVRSAAAISVGFWAIGQVMHGTWGRYLPGVADGEASADVFTDDAHHLEFPDAQLKNLPGEFIFDVQTHHIDSGGAWRVDNPGFHAVFAALWSQSGPLGGVPGMDGKGNIHGWGKGGEIDPIENLSRYHYFKELYLDSSTTMTVLSCVPSEESQQPLPVGDAAETVHMVNALAHNTPRAVMHAFVMPNRGSYGTQPFTKSKPLYMQAEFDQMDANLQRYGSLIRGWKTYTPWGDVPYASGWFLDDEVGMAFIDHVRYAHHKHGGPAVIASHKGFALPAFDQRSASPRDVGPAARQNRDITFIVYHSGYDSEKQTAYPGDDKVNSADRGVDCFIKTLRENDYDATKFVPAGLEHGNVPNVYAEIGSTMQSVFGDPDQAAHLLGKLITYVGPQRVVWGTDSLWFGSPQPVIVALRRFDFTAKAREFYNLPHGLNGDRFDPRLDALDPHSYRRPHPHVRDWPTDGRAHPERTIRNGIFGRNAAVPYRVEPDAMRKKISADDVQKIRDAYLANPMTPREVKPQASNEMVAPRTRRQLFSMVWPNAPWTP